ncbi:hypothetical protein DL93DRAFT_2159148 [Clavulina sp. PMI_390]|nr:hypothetical protein DL93DRAFT_2159148 [Clavulina sp. PMI_390]
MSNRDILVLGRDLLLDLLTFFDDPRDLLCLRMTSSDLERLTRERIVWKRVLDTQCLQFRIPRCTYPFEAMNAAQLERAVLLPYLYMKRLASFDPTPLHKRTMRLKPTELAATAVGASEPFSPVVIPLPGGRFLVSISGLGVICIWDLGPYAEVPNREVDHPVCMLSIPPPVPNNALTNPKGVVVRALPTSSGNVWRLLGVYDTLSGMVDNLGLEYFDIYECTIGLVVLPGGSISCKTMTDWRLLARANGPPDHTADGRWMFFGRFDSDLIIVHDLFEQRRGVVRTKLSDSPHRYSIAYMHIHPTNFREGKCDEVDATVVYNIESETHAQIYQLRIPLHDWLDPLLTDNVERAPHIPLHITHIPWNLPNSNFPNAMLPQYATDPPTLLWSDTTPPRIHRMGTIRAPGRNDEFLALMPAEHLSERVTFTVVDMYRLGKTIALFGNTEALPRTVRCLVVHETWEAPVGQSEGHEVVVIPTGAQMATEWWQNPWRGYCYSMITHDRTSAEYMDMESHLFGDFAQPCQRNGNASVVRADAGVITVKSRPSGSSSGIVPPVDTIYERHCVSELNTNTPPEASIYLPQVLI